MIDLRGHIKLIDFGLARKALTYKNQPDLNGSQLYSFCGSPSYIAPEIIARREYDHKVDYYSLGVILYEMLTGKPPIDIQAGSEIKRVLEEEIEWPRDVSRGVLGLMKDLLCKNPHLRVTQFGYYKEKLKGLGVDMDILEKDRYAEIAIFTQKSIFSEKNFKIFLTFF